MADKGSNKRRILVLDTNVLMHDPAALFHFQEHDIYIPMIVLEELDAAKQGLSEVARNARQTSRFFDDLLTRANRAKREKGKRRERRDLDIAYIQHTYNIHTTYIHDIHTSYI